jgi:hypothetical protein
MSTRLPTVSYLGTQRPAGPMYRSIVAVDLEGSTMRTNPVKGELRRIMYELLGRSLAAAAITASHLEPLTDRGDGVLLLIRPHDDVPKTVLLDRLIPLLTAFLAEYDEAVTHPALRMRLRAVVHAGEVHSDSRGFYGEAIDIAIRLLDAPAVKTALRQAASPLVLVISEEIHSGIVAQGYIETGSYHPGVRVRVGNRQHRGWVHVPDSGILPVIPTLKQGGRPARAERPPLIAVTDELGERVLPVSAGHAHRVAAK